MPSITERISNWFKNQAAQYQVQKALATRDSVVHNTIVEQTSKAQEIDNTPGISALEKEERQLGMRKNLYEPEVFEQGASHRYMESSANLQDAISELGDPSDFTPEGKGIGGFFGRLFNGRFFKSSRETASQELQQFNTMPGFSLQDSQRLDELKAIKAEKLAGARTALGAAKTDPECSDFAHQYMFETAKALYPLQGKEAPKTFEEFNEKRTSIKNSRQLQAFLKPTPEFLEHNIHVMSILTDLDENGKFRDQVAAVKIVQDRMREIDQTVDVNTLNPADFNSCREKYPSMEALYTSFHPISDLTKPEGCFTDESFKQIFPTAEAYMQSKAKANFIMNVCDQTRAQLIKDSGDDMQYKLGREARFNTMQEVREAKDSRLAGVTGLNGKTTLAEYRQVAENNHVIALDSRFKEPTREKVSVDALKQEAGLSSHEQQRKVEAPVSERKEPSLASHGKER